MPSRRAFIASSLSASAGLIAIPRGQPARAQTSTVLRLQDRRIEVNGKPATVYGVLQPDGTAGITTQVGRQFRVRVENAIAQPSLVHWHGLTPPWQQDGVLGISGPPIRPGAAADYDFPLRFGGTFWMHSHYGLQEQRLMAAPLIIHDQRDRPGEHQIVLMLADFSFTPPEEIFANLKKRSGSMPAASMAGMGTANASAPDLNDVTYDAFVANDRTLSDPEVVEVEPGGTALLRVINSAAMSNFHVDLGQLDGRLIAVDGFQVVPTAGRRFPLAVAQRLDIRLTIPRASEAYPILAVLEGERAQTGIILRAGGASVARVEDTAPSASAALTLDLERRLRALAPLKPRRPGRVLTADLTGEMAGYIWSINNVVWNKDVPPFEVSKGERVELVMTNRTPMPHPMHLHGHEFQVVEINGERFPGAVRDTVLVPPGKRVVVAFDADNPGLWAFHCHLLYHLEAGMFRTIRYTAM